MLIQTPTPYSRIIGRHNFIIMYHGVTDMKNAYNTRHAYVHDFEKQIRYLSKHCNLISVQDFFQENFDPKKCNVALTFDDGFRNNLLHAAPILKKYDTPASFYITGLETTEHPYIWADFYQIALHKAEKTIRVGGEEFVKEGKQYVSVKHGFDILHFIKAIKPHYEVKLELYDQLKSEFASVKENSKEFWELMTKQDLQTLVSDFPTITLGSHGFFHNNLGVIDQDKAKQELIQSKEYLESITQKEVNEIGYPDGSYSRSVMDVAESIGFKYQLATDNYFHAEDANDNRIRTRKGVYQIGSWNSQLNLKF